VCGEADTDVLVLDHINNDGAMHRRTLTNYRNLFVSLKKAGYPPLVQVLCANDNMRKERERIRKNRELRFGSSGT
jgi:hypothetical protein